jgi:hypothetical protein
MIDMIFLAALVLLLGVLFRWAFATLPGDGWQIMAAVPLLRQDEQTWRGLNLTFYGLFIACSAALAAMMVVILLGSMGIKPAASFTMMAVILAVCIPSSKFAARIVERKRHTLTIGGASFVGILLAPCSVWLTAAIGPPEYHIPMVAGLAAMSVAYALGEGLGRLACISFGCCYGRPLAECHPLVRRVFSRCSFVFSGATKKIAYEGCMEGTEVLPIQAITALIYAGAGLLGTALYLRGYCSAAFGWSIFVTLGWRVLSEIFRVDYRGAGRISVYQILAAVGMIYACLLLIFLPTEPLTRPDLRAGLGELWDPLTIVCLQSLWLTVFFFTARSTVTASSIEFYVVNQPRAVPPSQNEP